MLTAQGSGCRHPFWLHSCRRCALDARDERVRYIPPTPSFVIRMGEKDERGHACHRWFYPIREVELSQPLSSQKSHQITIPHLIPHTSLPQIADLPHSLDQLIPYNAITRNVQPSIYTKWFLNNYWWQRSEHLPNQGLFQCAVFHQGQRAHMEGCSVRGRRNG